MEFRVVIPLFNNERHIERAIKSVINQMEVCGVAAGGCVTNPCGCVRPYTQGKKTPFHRQTRKIAKKYVARGIIFCPGPN